MITYDSECIKLCAVFWNAGDKFGCHTGIILSFVFAKHSDEVLFLFQEETCGKCKSLNMFFHGASFSLALFYA